MTYVPLGVRTAFSFQDGMCRIEPLVERVRDLRLPAVGIADVGSTFAFAPFHAAAHAAGIRPLLGVTLRLQPDTPQHEEWGDAPAFLQLIARDRDGLRNLLRLVSRAHLEIPVGAPGNAEPGTGFQDLEAFAAGVLAIDPGPDGPIARAAARGGDAAALRVTSRLRDVFGREGFWMGLQRGGAELGSDAARQHLARTLNVPLVALTDVRCLDVEDVEAAAVWRRMARSGRVGRVARVTRAGVLRSDLEMRTLFRDVPEAVANTHVIAERCQVEFEWGVVRPFRGASASGRAPMDELRHACGRGAAMRFDRHHEDLPVAVRDRLARELAVIEEEGLASGFLVVQDVVRQARARGATLGPGRGAAAGSLVCHLLGISDLDPVEHGLVFERFVSRSRHGMPVFELEVAHVDRDAVVRDVLQTYGSERAAHAASLAQASARGLVRTVGATLGCDAAVLDAVDDALRTDASGDLALERSPRVAQLYQHDPAARRLIEVARRLEGLPRHAALQAGSLWIAPDRLTDVVALQRARWGDVIVQATETGAQALGLLRLDVVASRAVTVVGDSVRLAAHPLAAEPPLDDAPTLARLADGDTLGLPELDGAASQSALRAVRPVAFADVVTAMALARLGAHHNERLERVWSIPDAATDALRSRVAPIVGVTRGLLLFPEQLVQLAGAVAGYAAGDAQALCDALQRRRIGELVRHRSRFLAGALERGLPLADAEMAFDALLHFTNFDFDRAHATAAALLGYHATYLRTHAGAAYTVAALRRAGSAERVRRLVGDALAHDVRVLPIDINDSDWEYAVRGGAVRVGFVQVRGLGETTARRLLDARRRDGLFPSVADVRARVPEVGPALLTMLAKSGAFDAIAGSRSAALQAVAESASAAAAATAAAQLEIGFEAEPTLLPGEELSVEERAALEREALGIASHSDPLLRHIGAWERLQLVPSARLAAAAEGEPVRVGGRVRRVIETKTRRGEAMAFVVLEDPWGEFEVVLFPPAFARTERRRLVTGGSEFVEVAGTIERTRGVARVRGEQVQALVVDARAAVVPLTAAVAMRARATTAARTTVARTTVAGTTTAARTTIARATATAAAAGDVASASASDVANARASAAGGTGARAGSRATGRAARGPRASGRGIVRREAS